MKERVKGHGDSDTKIRLVASDLDGTLLDSGSKLPERNIAAISRLKEHQVAFTISTGRMFGSAVEFARMLDVKIPIICYNGAMLSRPDGTRIFHKTLDMGVAVRALGIFREKGVYVQSYVEDVLCIRSLDDPEYKEYVRRFGITGTAVGDAVYSPQTSPTKVLAFTGGSEESQTLMRSLSEILGDDAYITSSNPEFVEVMNPEVNKGKALAALADMLGVGMPDVMALGDGENDAKMIGKAGLGVAMGNAGPRVKAVADVIAPANDECGVAWALEKYVLDISG